MQGSSPVTAAGPHRLCTGFPIMPHGTCTCFYCKDQGETVKGEGGEKIKKKPKEGRIGRTGQFCPEKSKVQGPESKVIAAGKKPARSSQVLRVSRRSMRNCQEKRHFSQFVRRIKRFPNFFVDKKIYLFKKSR